MSMGAELNGTCMKLQDTPRSNLNGNFFTGQMQPWLRAGPEMLVTQSVAAVLEMLVRGPVVLTAWRVGIKTVGGLS